MITPSLYILISLKCSRGSPALPNRQSTGSPSFISKTLGSNLSGVCTSPNSSNLNVFKPSGFTILGKARPAPELTYPPEKAVAMFFLVFLLFELQKTWKE